MVPRNRLDKKKQRKSGRLHIHFQLVKITNRFQNTPKLIFKRIKCHRSSLFVT